MLCLLLHPLLLSGAIMLPPSEVLKDQQSLGNIVASQEITPFVVGSGDEYPSGNVPDPAIVLSPAIWELSRDGVEQVGQDSEGCDDGQPFLDFVPAADINACVDCCKANARCRFVVFYGSDPRSFLHDYYDPNSPLCKLVEHCDAQKSTSTQPTKSYSVENSALAMKSKVTSIKSHTAQISSGTTAAAVIALIGAVVGMAVLLTVLAGKVKRQGAGEETAFRTPCPASGATRQGAIACL
jgi:hypothetical protein